LRSPERITQRRAPTKKEFVLGKVEIINLMDQYLAAHLGNFVAYVDLPLSE
jgi:hypothetical protein